MLIIERLGYVVIIYWSFKLTRILSRRIYRNFMGKNKSVDLRSVGKWAAITGCSHGVGKAYADALAKLGPNQISHPITINKGLNLILINPETDALTPIAEEIEAMYNVKTKIVKFEVTDSLDAFTKIEKETYGLDIGILINNLGLCYPHPEYFLDLPRNDRIYMSIIQCNIVVVTNMCRIVLPQMVARGKGVIVNISSAMAVLPSPLLTVFAATKAYIVKFSKDLQIEYARDGIIVQCLLPGTLTNHTIDSPKPSWFVPTPEKYVDSAIKTIGKENVTTGFFQHSLLISLAKFVYRVSPKFVVFWIISMMEGNRNNILRRYIG